MIDKQKSSRNGTMIKILSVIAAFLLWLYVMDEQNPSVNRIYTVKLATVNLPNDVVVVDDPVDVRVKLRGSRVVLADTTSDEVQAYVDLQGAEKGSHSRNVQVKLPQKTQLLEILPDKVVLNVDDLARRSAPIEVDLIGDLPEDYTLDSTVLSPNHAIIYGPNSLLEKVEHVKAIFNVDKNTKGDVKARVQLVATDASGNSVNKVTIDPENVYLTAVFKEKITTKKIPVKVFLQGESAQGYRIASVTTLPGEIEITGSDKLVKEVVEYSINDIQVSGLKSTFSQKVVVKLPEGVTSSTAEIEVVVSVERQ